jgi:hypothetical protein
VLVQRSSVPAHPAAPPPAPAKAAGKFTYQGSLGCSTCHAEKGGFPTDLVQLTEMQTWRIKDKHAQSYTVLLGPRGKRMGELLGVDVTHPEAGCLGCHAIDIRQPSGEKKVGDDLVAEDLLTNGIGCEGCHGPSSIWQGQHFLPVVWRGKSAQEKADLGLTDLRNPRVRSELCLSCHIGNAGQGKVVTHAMYAAGHPALPSVEVAQFSENMPRHWYHTRDIPLLKKATPEQRKSLRDDQGQFQQTRLALVGAVSAMRSYTQLLQERATPTPKFMAGRWPELVAAARDGWDGKAAQLIEENWPELVMTHFECSACHHDLQVPSYRQERGYRGIPGRPTPPVWMRLLLPVAVAQAGGKTDADSSSLTRYLGDFDNACLDIPFGRPFGASPSIRGASSPLVAWCDGVLDRLEELKLDRGAAQSILAALLDTPADKIRDYDSARQLVAMIDVVHGELATAAGKEPEPLLDDLKTRLNLNRDPVASEREKYLRSVVLELAGKGPEDNFAQALISTLAKNRLTRTLAEPSQLGKLSTINEKSLAQSAQRAAAFQPREVAEALKALRSKLLGK